MSQTIRLSREEREALVQELFAEIRAYQTDQDVFDDAASARLGINRTDERCLDIVDRYGRVTAGQLAADARLSTGAVTTVLDRLERAGLVRRVRDTADRRRVLVELTDEARNRAWEIWGPIAEDAAKQMDRFSDAELVFLREFLAASRELLARHLERITSEPA
jgi:DNA-binding MarR family transcriptional regulator